MTKAEYISEIVANFSVLKRCLHSRFQDSGMGTDLSMTHLQALMIIAHDGPFSQTELAERLRLSAGSVSQIIDHLAERGLIDRDPGKEDRRLTFISLSAKGKSRLKRLRRQGHAAFASSLEALSLSELEAFLAIELKIINNMSGQPKSR